MWGARGFLAFAQHQAGKQLEAKQLFEEAEKHWDSSKEKDAVLHPLNKFWHSDLIVELGQPEKAQKLIIDSAEKLDGKKRGFWEEVRLGCENYMQGRILMKAEGTDRNLVKARCHLNTAADHFDKLRRDDHLLRVLITRGECRLDEYDFNLVQQKPPITKADASKIAEDLRQIKSDLDRAYKTAKWRKLALFEVDCHLQYTRFYLDSNKSKGNVNKAFKHYDDAKNLIRQTGYHRRDDQLKDLGGKLSNLR